MNTLSCCICKNPVVVVQQTVRKNEGCEDTIELSLECITCEDHISCILELPIKYKE